MSVNQKKDIVVQVEDLPRNVSVKLVKLRMGQDEGRAGASESRKAGKRERIKKKFTSIEMLTNTLVREVQTSLPSHFTSWFAKSPLRNEKEKKNDVQLKLVDMGGHSATTLLAAASASSNNLFAFYKFDCQSMKNHES